MAARRRPYLGAYNPSLIVTYLGVTASVVGVSLAISGYQMLTVICLIIAAVCDMFDGPIARRIRRTPDEQLFGVQIDSLADLLAFCVLPVVLFSSLGFRQWYHVVAYTLLMLAGITRLGWFNVQAFGTSGGTPTKSFTGLPVIMTALVVPILWLLLRFIGPAAFGPVLTVVTLLLSAAFVANIQISKPPVSRYGLPVILAAALIYAILLVGP